MGLFDKMKQAAANVSGNQTVTFTFQALPESLAQMQALPEASLDTPFKTAALTVCALCAYGADKNIGLEMLNWLRGPRPLNGQEISFLNDRFRDGKSYIPFSYFVGASPENGYTPRQPFTLLVGSNHTSNVEEGYCKLFIPCGGADAPRPIKLRRKVEYYQWVEHRRSEKRQKLGGGEETVTTYTYSREWVNHPVDSQSFKQMVGHENKTRIQTEAADWLAPNVTFGAYRFPAFLARSIGGEKPLDISLTDTQRADFL